MIELKGPWKLGYSFDVYTTSSVFIGNNQWGHPLFDNTYSPMGKLVKDFKYGQEVSKLSNIFESSKLIACSNDKNNLGNLRITSVVK